MTDELSADERHLGRMRDTIDDYFAERIDFRRLINNLDALFASVEIISDEWREEFLGHWGHLEEILARLLVMIETQRLARRSGADG